MCRFKALSPRVDPLFLAVSAPSQGAAVVGDALRGCHYVGGLLTWYGMATRRQQLCPLSLLQGTVETVLTYVGTWHPSISPRLWSAKQPDLLQVACTASCCVKLLDHRCGRLQTPGDTCHALSQPLLCAALQPGQVHTVGLVSSNWSAPKALTLGLMPPVPRATTYSEKKSSAFCHQVALAP